MGLLNLPLRFLGRQARWFARGAGVVVAGGVFEFLRRHEALHVPGIAEPYEIGATDPYWISVVAYLTTTWIIKRILGVLLQEARSHIQRVSRGGWFRH